MRYRSPLFLARVDPARLTLLRATEQVVFPLTGDPQRHPGMVAHLGNFHCNPVSPALSFITVGETIPDDGFRGDTLLARVHWK